MELIPVRNELRPVSDYVVRNSGKPTARQVLASPNCASLPEILFPATHYQGVARCYRDNPGTGAWAGVVRYADDGKTFYLPPGSIKIPSDL